MNKHLKDIFRAYFALPAECQAAFDSVIGTGSEPADAPSAPATLSTATARTSHVAQPITARTIAREIDAVRRGPCPVEPVTSPDSGRLEPLGGRGLDLSITDRFLDEGFLDRWRPGHSMGIYAAGCRGTTALAGRLRRPIFKLGVHEGLDAGPRLKDLGRCRYGSARLEGGELIIDAGFEAWTPEPLSPKQPMVPGSPVSFGLDGLIVTCPVDMSPQGFDQSLARALSPDSLETFIWSRGGQSWCKRRGIEPATLLRYTPVADRGRTASASKELTIIRPKFDAMRLVRIAENIVYDHVIGAGAPATIVDLDETPRQRASAPCSGRQAPSGLTISMSTLSSNVR